jgi:hypothetical protein
MSSDGNKGFLVLRKTLHVSIARSQYLKKLDVYLTHVTTTGRARYPEWTFSGTLNLRCFELASCLTYR